MFTQFRGSSADAHPCIHLQSFKLLCPTVQFKRRYIYKKIHYLTFDLWLKVTQNILQYPLHHVIYASAKFEVATSNCLEEDTIARNVTDGTKLIYPIFLTKKWVQQVV